MADYTAGRDALLAEVGRALRSVRPERAEALLQQLEYATGRDTRTVSDRTAPLSGQEREDVMLAALLVSANRVEALLPWGRRVTWHVRVTPVVDTTVMLLGVEAEPIDERTQAAVLAGCFASAFAPELGSLARGELGEAKVPDWFFPRLRVMAPTREVQSQLTVNVVSVIAPPPGSSGAILPPAPARFGVIAEIAAPLRECFPGRAEAILDELWALVARPVPRAKAVRHDGGPPGSTPRQLALELVALMNAVELEQPEAIRVQWSAAPAPAHAIDFRAAAVGG